MNFETVSSRTSVSQRFGKRVIGWHVYVLIYHQYQYCVVKCEMIAKKYIVYLDQILKDTNKQDGFDVVDLLETALIAIHDELPYISNIILQSDNAKSYQNHYLTFMIHMFST